MNMHFNQVNYKLTQDPHFKTTSLAECHWLVSVI
jgi:hypothetical protein